MRNSTDVRSVERKITTLGVLPIASPTTLNLNYTPSAGVAALWDRYVVDKIVVRLFKLEGTSPSIVAYDPVIPSALTTPAQVVAYANSTFITPTYGFSTAANCSGHLNYEIDKPTHSDATAIGNLRTPVTTNQSWPAGALIHSTMNGSSGSNIAYALEWYVTFYGPRTDA